MIPGLKEKMYAKMRVAYTRACVTFPRVDPDPISGALWQVYSAVALELGSTYPMGEPVVQEDIVNLTEMAIVQILAKSDLAQATAGMSPQSAKHFAVIGGGLDQATAMNLYRYQQQYRADFQGLAQQRNTALESRRNILANNMVDLAEREAKETMSKIDWGDIQHA